MSFVLISYRMCWLVSFLVNSTTKKSFFFSSAIPYKVQKPLRRITTLHVPYSSLVNHRNSPTVLPREGNSTGLSLGLSFPSTTPQGKNYPRNAAKGAGVVKIVDTLGNEFIKTKIKDQRSKMDQVAPPYLYCNPLSSQVPPTTDPCIQEVPYLYT